MRLLRQMAFQKEKISGTEFDEFISVLPFEPDADISGHACDILNAKVKDMQEQFKIRLRVLKEKTRYLEGEVELYKDITNNPISNGVKAKRSLNEIVRQLYETGCTANELWKILTEEFGSLFFIKTIEEELGMSSPVSYTHLTLPTKRIV
eukprot:TRINITY_DN13627_c0_g1_i1.p1 TRINITY_DN13627_c0_g1~~TRINITY_DN13627_c0_g1_i1.p1  ORF type:complete len:150 (-),score=46.38 TRINITY_DN13627_c0_g1_i1:12-461(-)